MIYAKKSLGQNFLIDKNIILNIVNSLSLSNNDVILEIGPGHGEITKYLLDKVKKVIVCEIDKYLAKELTEHFSDRKNIEIINCDFLKLDLKKIIKENKKIKVFGNLPYYISTPIIAKLLQDREFIDAIYLTLQKELVTRIISKDNSKEKGAFSFFVQYYCHPYLLFDISKNCFRPRPKVDSSFVKLEIKEPSLNKDDEDLFFKIIRRAFCYRRKSLRNSLKELFPKNVLLDNSIFDFNLRPEALNQEDFVKLVDLYKKINCRGGPACPPEY